MAIWWRRAPDEAAYLLPGVRRRVPGRDDGRTRRLSRGDGRVHVHWCVCAPSCLPPSVRLSVQSSRLPAYLSVCASGGLPACLLARCFSHKRRVISAWLRADYPEYSLLAARIAVSNLHKQTKKSFISTMTDLHNYVNPKTQKKSPLVSDHGARNGCYNAVPSPRAFSRVLLAGPQCSSSCRTTRNSWTPLLCTIVTCPTISLPSRCAAGHA
jgi:hypothetical protein